MVFWGPPESTLQTISVCVLPVSAQLTDTDCATSVALGRIRALDACDDPLTNRQLRFLCWRTTCMEQAADRAVAAAVDHLFSLSVENIFVPVCVRTLGKLVL